MQLVINGESQTVDTLSDIETITLEALLQQFGYEVRSVAVAMNGQFVPRKEYASKVLNEGQSLEILSPMQGG